MLAFVGDPSPGACAAGGSHIHTGSFDYALMANVSVPGAQSNWRWCKRGDVWWGTAPPQAFMVAMVVYDEAGKGYGFTHSGEIPSAPQQGSVAEWNITQNSRIIAENWAAIAATNYATAYWYNNYDESFWEVIGSWVDSALNWLQQNAGTIGQVISVISTIGSVVADLAEPTPHPAPLPAGVPSGAAASAGGSSKPQASATPAGNLASPVEPKTPNDMPSVATTAGG